MKKQFFNLFYVLALAVLFTACGDDDVDTPVYGEATMTSFGFYAEDNAGNLLSDYIVDNVAGSITISLPDYVDKTALIARFELTEDDTAYVNGVAQQSGVTANDFSSPVDYIVTEGTNNTKYTVTVGELPAAVWTQAATDATDLREFTMKVNPVDGMPYLAYALRMEEDDDEKAGVFKFDGTSLVNVGGQTISEGEAGNPGISFDADGNPMVVFSDYTNPNPYKEGSTTYSASVMSYNGTSWAYVGGDAGKGVTDVRITFNDIIVKEDGTVMAFLVNNAAGNLAKRELNLSEYNGSSWTTSIQMPGRAATKASYLPVAKLIDGVVYLAVFNNESGIGTFSVYKNVNGSWTTLVDAYLSPGAKSGNFRDFDMDVDDNGNVFVCFVDDAESQGIYRPKVIKYDADTQTWKQLGSTLVVDYSSTREFSLAVSPVGTPFLMYRNDNMFPEVVSFDEDTQDWTTPSQLDAVESENLYMGFAPNGVAYAAFTSSATGGTVLYKYDIPAE